MRTALLISAIILAASTSPAQVPVVPGGAGFGMSTPAGRGGKVLVVTNLHDRGPGSLREALENTRGARTIVFEVGGYIDLQSRLFVKHPNVTVAGQTAPSPGITLRYNSLTIQASDVLVQHIRIRIGGRNYHGEPPDALQLLARKPGDVSNVVIDHCSMSWAVDETIGMGDKGSRDVTFTNCIIAEGLRRSSHKVGPTSMGALVHIGNQRVAFIGNLFAHNKTRNPKWSDSTSGVVVNNLIYNVHNVPDLTPFSKPPGAARLAIVGNCVIAGALKNKVATRAFLLQKGNAQGTQVFIDDNVCDGCTGSWADDVAGNGVSETWVAAASAPVWPDGFEAMAGSECMDYVLENAGARPWDRDAADARVVQSVRERSGDFIDCVVSAPLVLERGFVSDAGATTVLLRRGPESSIFKDAYKEFTIEVQSGDGEKHTRRITRYDPQTLTCEVDRPWDEGILPSNGDRFVIYETCDANAGGWEPLASTRRALEIPSSPKQIMPSGYTRLEEWIHGFNGDGSP